MSRVGDVLQLIFYLTKLTRRKLSLRLACKLLYECYKLIELDVLLDMQLSLHCIPNEIFSFLVMKHGKCNESYVDNNLYILCNSKVPVDKSTNWFYIFCDVSLKKYKVAVIFTDDVLEGNIYVSENMKHNINKKLKVQESNDPFYFLIPVHSNSTACAKEMKISLITNPYESTESLINDLLQNFFSTPKYLRIGDIFSIRVKKYIPEAQYCAADSKLEILHFKVNSMEIESQHNKRNGNFVVYGETTVIQEANINSYKPYICLCVIPLETKEHFSGGNWPPALDGLHEQLQSCIAPFLGKDLCINVKPVFLVEGPAGSGKSRLVKITAESLGLHLLEHDISEVQSLTSAQTEAKLRIIIQDSVTCTPCILMLRNIQLLGINSEGQKDERVLASFTGEIKKLYSKKLKFPLIIIATSNDSEISLDAEKTFVEKIQIGHLDQKQRCEILSWLIESKGLKHQVDLQKLTKLCSDFLLADLEALVLHAMKNSFKLFSSSENCGVKELTNDDFIHACEYMQSIFSDQIGAPRVPKVHWEDIGGLADLKHEIMRRIEMPLLNISGMGRSGLLLYGPPGTGKTLLAKAVATECQLHFLSVKGPELLNMYVGQSEKNVRQVFERARAAAPCIIFFDELDSLAPNRGQSGDSGGVMDRVVSQLLAEMDGLESTGNVFIIAATNRPDLIDPALLRPGRFDKMLYVGICSDADSQISVLKALTRKFKMEKDGQELKDLISELPNNLTGADLYSVCSNAWLTAVRRTLTSTEIEKDKVKGEDVIVKLDDFVHAGKDLVPSVSREEMLRYERLRNELSSR